MKYKKKGFDYSLLDVTIKLTEEYSPFDRVAVTGNNNPLVVEIGCGNGHFLTKQAVNNPHQNFIGIDLKDYRIVKSRMKELSLNIPNVFWINSEAQKALERMFEPSSIHQIYMTFPDPWPKKRHNKHRLFQKDFIEILYKTLEVNGKFIFISDHEEYYQWCIDLLHDEKRFEIISNEYSDDLTESAFGNIWKEEKRLFYSFTMVKT